MSTRAAETLRRPPGTRRRREDGRGKMEEGRESGRHVFAKTPLPEPLPQKLS